MVTPDDIWLGDWHAKIRGRLHSQGCETVSDFAKLHPLLSHVKLARLLGPDIAAVQVAMMQFEEAKATDSLRKTAKDALCRSLLEHIKHGWKKSIHASRMTGRAYAEWLVMLEFRALAPELLPTGQAVWDALIASNPPIGWLPSGPDDPIITAAFDKAWPISNRRKIKRQQYGLLCPKCTAVLALPNAQTAEIVCRLCGEQIELV